MSGVQRYICMLVCMLIWINLIFPDNLAGIRLEAFFTLALVSQTMKLISGLVIQTTQLSFLNISLNMVNSISHILCFELLQQCFVM